MSNNFLEFTNFCNLNYYNQGPNIAQYLRIYKLQNTSHKLLVISTNTSCCTIILVTVVNSAKFY
jgi:hypothetical protein